jgi:YggT family protein
VSNLLGQILFWVFTILWGAIWARVIISWLPWLNINIDPDNLIVRIIYEVTDPILVPLRRFTTIGMIDWSPLVALLIIGLIRNVFRGFF